MSGAAFAAGLRAAVFGSAPYYAAFLAALALAAAAARAVPAPWRRAFHSAAGIAFLAAFLSPSLAAALVLLALCVRAAAGGGSARRVASAAGLLLAAGAPLVYGGFFLRYKGGILLPADWIRAFFLVDFLKKNVYYLYESAVGKLPRGGPAEHLAYFFALPALVGAGVAPSPAHWRERWESRPPAEALTAGIATIVKAALHLLLFAALVAWLPGSFIFRHADPSLAAWPWRRAWTAFAATYVAFYLARYGHEQTCVGAARVLGWDIHDNYESPLTAPDYAEHWRRWNTHFRDLLLSMFYYPAALSLSRRRPERAWFNMAAAGLATFAGSGVFNFMVHAVFVAPLAWVSYLKLAEQVALYEGFQWAMVTAASSARLRRRAAGRAEPGAASRALGAVTTLLLRGVSLPLLMLDEPPIGWGLAARLLSAAL